MQNAAKILRVLYTISPSFFELDPAVDTRKLSDAIARMVSAHSYLLTQVYLDDNGEMVQRLEMRHLRRK